MVTANKTIPVGGCGRRFLLFMVSLMFLCAFTVGSESHASGISLISAVDLNRNLTEYRVLDARPAKLWKKGRIPGARSFSWEEYTGTDENEIPYTLLPPERLAAALSKMGIHEASHVVVYGDADKSWGGEGWVCWVLTWLGHKGKIELLEGGIKAWKKRGYVVEEPLGQKPAKPAAYRFNINGEISATVADIKACDGGCYLVDTRSFGEWITGRIPGAVHISWKKFYKGSLRTPLSFPETEKLLRKNGIGTDKPVIYYCAGGVRSAYAWLVHGLSGQKNRAVNFEGGMVAWERLADD